jgi:DNA polymerase-3 subunit alpha
LDGERDTLGLYLTGHPFEEYEEEVRSIASRIADVTGDKPAVSNEGFQFRGKPATIAGMVFDLGKRGSRMVFTMDDRSGRLECSMFEDVFQQYRNQIAKSAILIVEGSLRFDEFIEGWRLTAKKVIDIDQAREQYARRLVLRWPTDAGPDFVRKLETTLRPFCGGRCSVAIRYYSSAARADLVLSEEWMVKPTRELTDKLSQLLGNDGLRLIYTAREN